LWECCSVWTPEGKCRNLADNHSGPQRSKSHQCSNSLVAEESALKMPRNPTLNLTGRGGAAGSCSISPSAAGSKTFSWLHRQKASFVLITVHDDVLHLPEYLQLIGQASGTGDAFGASYQQPSTYHTSSEWNKHPDFLTYVIACGLIALMLCIGLQAITSLIKV